MRSTNLTLVFSNGLYAAESYTVPASLISNLMAAAVRPWPKPGSNAWPGFTLDPANLGLDAAWLKTNYQRLLDSYAAKPGGIPFPNASERQRAWLTNTLTDLDLLGEGVRRPYATFWTDDYPSLELRFERDDGQIVEQVFRLSTKAQQQFMLPWQVYDGTNEFTTGNAEVSRAVAELLPPGFLNRDRVKGDLFQMVRSGFLGAGKVQEFIMRSTLEQTFGNLSNGWPQGIEPGNIMISGSYGHYPDTFTATLHRTNWPARLRIPVTTGIERGVVTGLKGMLETAQTKVDPLLEQNWLLSRVKGSNDFVVEVLLDSPDHQWLRGHMEAAGQVAFYDRIQPALHRSLGFTLHEGIYRASQWALLEDGRLLLYGFSGDGVLDWSPEQLGFHGDQRLLHSSSVNFVAVFVGPQGTITEVVLPEQK